MNIQRIRVKNFRSIGNIEIDLRTVDVAAVVGANGEGKSSLAAYAFTYCFWGVVPDIVTFDLIRRGTTNMEVEVDFTDDSGDLYRVLRQAKVTSVKNRSVTSAMTLSRVMSDGSLETFSGNSIDATTAKVVEMMGGLSLKTAMYSNLALQGEFERFMQVKPAERRALYEDILNLGVYEDLEKMAKERVKTERAALASLDVDDTKEAQTEAAIVELQQQLTLAQTKRDTTQTTIEALIVAIKHLETLVGEGTTTLETRIGQLASTIAGLRTQLEASLKKRETAQKIVDRKTDIEKAYKELQSLVAQMDALQPIRQQFVSIDEKCKGITEKVALVETQKGQAEKELSSLISRRDAGCQKMRTSLGITDTGADLTVAIGGLLEAKSKEVTDQAAKIESLQTALREARDANDRQATELAYLESDVEAQKETIARMQEATPICPILKKTCPSLHPDQMKETIAQAQEALRVLEASLPTEIAKKQELATAVQVAQGNLDSAQKAMNQMNMVMQGLETSKNTYTTNEEQFTLTKMQKESNVTALQIQIDQLKSDGELAFQEAQGLSDQLVDYDSIGTAIATLRASGCESTYQQLLVCEETLAGSEATVRDLEKRIQDLTEESDKLVAEVQAKRAELSEIEPKLVQQRSSLAMQKADLDNQNDVIAGLSESLGTQQTILEDIRRRKNASAVHRKNLAVYDGAAKTYQMIRALITENSVPRFQQFCNEILDFLGISIRIRIETLEETTDGKGNPKVNRVFKIIVLDGSGEERLYETWSGGEKHRINLAIRHALAMTLLNRSGARMGLMVIDEGDTKLDAMGKAALLQLIEATNQGRFGYPAKVLFITHAEDIIDRLPHRIKLNKSEITGSNAAIQ